jgi:perosamine synthetase
MSNPTDSRPALLGGTPLFPEGPPPWPPVEPELDNIFQEAIATGSWGQYHGPNVPALELELAVQFEAKNALLCASGTLAVDVALRAIGVGSGDEVILSAYDYESNFLTVHALGAKPVLIDCDPTSGQLDIHQLELARTPQTKVIIASHLHGGLVSMPAVMTWANMNGVFVVEDAAQCPGAILEGKPVGSWGHIGTLSFGGSKLLSAGRGGAVLTNDDRLYQRMKVILTRGVQQWAAMSELQAMVLRPQLRRLEEQTLMRVLRVGEIVELKKEVKGLEQWHTNSPHNPLKPGKNGTMHAFYKVGFHFDATKFGMTRDLFCRALRAEGVAFDPGFSALHRGRSPSRFRAIDDLPNASRLHDNCVILHHPVLLHGEGAAKRVAAAIIRTYRNADAISRSWS